MKALKKFLKTKTVLIGLLKYVYFWLISMSRQDESNPALLLATRVGKMELSCLLGTTCHVPQERFSRKPC